MSFNKFSYSQVHSVQFQGFYNLHRMARTKRTFSTAAVQPTVTILVGQRGIKPIPVWNCGVSGVIKSHSD